MTRFWTRNRRNVVLAVSAAVVGLLGYLAYEVYQESAKEYASDDNDDDEDTRSEHSDVEDIIHIAQPIDETRTSSDIDTFRHTPTPASHAQPRHAKRQALAISARGLVFDSVSTDKWSADIRMRADAVSVLAQLAERYDVFLVAVVHPHPDEQSRILRCLEQSGVLTQPTAGSDVGESTVWVDRDGRSSTSPGILPVSRVLFCQTEEGKMHVVRHLLTASSAGYAGYIDTNRDVVARLSQVLHTCVLVSSESAPHPVVGHGD
ncbi:hypothetical protein GGF43_003227, partial [Coemansia sp. RSA 2618]